MSNLIDYLSKIYYQRIKRYGLNSVQMIRGDGHSSSKTLAIIRALTEEKESK